MSKAGKELCDCGQIATWCYMPGYLGGGNPYHCDECVARGCECNHYSTDGADYSPPGDVPAEGVLPTKEDEPIKWISKNTWTHVDDKGREYPCCEHMYEEAGWDKDNSNDSE